MSAPHLHAGREIRVNRTVTSDQDHAAVTILADGSQVVVWESAGQDGSGAGVYGRHFSATGVPISDEFRIAAATTGNQSRAQIAALDDGGFAVVWQAGGGSSDSPGWTEPWDIMLRLFDADGTARGAERLVNTTTANAQTWPDIATRDDGSLVVSWRGPYAPVGFQVFDATGTPQGGEALIPTQFGTYTQTVLALPTGGELLLWSTEDMNEPLMGLYGQIFAADGSAVTGRIQINAGEVYGDQVGAAAAALPGGGFAVTWLTTGGGWPPGIRARIFDASGTAVTGVFGVSEPTGAGFPGMAALADGSFVVAWAQPGTEGGDILARRFLADGTALGPARLVSVTVAGDQQVPQVAATADGGYVVTWQSQGQDGDGWGVYSRLFPAETYGTNAGDLLEDRHGTGWISGLGGDDTILGLAGDDTLSGGGGNDSVTGSLGQDSLWLGGGNDTGSGGDGDDRILGQDGADQLAGGAGADDLGGGRGSDMLSGDDGDDRLDGGEGADWLAGGTGNDSLSGRSGADTVLGQDGNDSLNGFEGADDLRGGAGNDVIWGGAGNDTLAGSAGDDTLRGGDGLDVFVFDASAGHDVVALFEPGIDQIRLDEDLWGGGLTVAEVVATYGRAVAGGVVLEFGGGASTIEIQGATLAGLAGDILLI